MNTSEKIKVILIGIFTAAASVLTYAQTMTVVVKNVKSDVGTVRLSVYNSEDHFMKNKIAAIEVKALNGQVVAVFKKLGTGTYAISVMHDANDNNELDSNFMGVPKEGFGFSNDAMGMFGPPDFEEASFQHAGKKDVVISLRYM